MADRLVLASRRAFPAGDISGHGVQIGEVEGLALASLTARKGAGQALQRCVTDRFGFVLPQAPRYSEANGVGALGTGPGAWLTVSQQPTTLTDKPWPERLAAVVEALGAVADQSGAYGVMEIDGPGSRDLLARGVSLDLDPSVFGEQAAAVTSFGHFGAILWRPGGPDRFRLALARSTAKDAWRWLSHIAHGLPARP